MIKFEERGYFVGGEPKLSKSYHTNYPFEGRGRVSVQGCTRPRPSPFKRPSTRYNGVRPPWGGVSIAGFRPKGGLIAGFSDFRARSARNGAEGAVLENFEDFMKILPN